VKFFTKLASSLRDPQGVPNARFGIPNRGYDDTGGAFVWIKTTPLRVQTLEEDEKGVFLIHTLGVRPCGWGLCRREH
jgi:hypothetical protein